MPSDFDNDGIKDEYCFKDSGNCGCPDRASWSERARCYGCWRDLKPPFINNLQVCYIYSGREICQVLNPNNPVFIIEKNDLQVINISWKTTENAKCVFRFIYDDTGNKVDLSLSNPEVRYFVLPNLNRGVYSKNFLITLNQNSSIRFKIDCFDKDTLEGPNYPPNVEKDKTCDVLNDILKTDTCKYRGSIGPIIVLDKDRYNFVKIQILDPDNRKLVDYTYFYQARRIRGLNILLLSYIFRYLKNEDYCSKEGTYKLEVLFNETSNNLVNRADYTWEVDWDTKEYCKEDCVGKEVAFGLSLNPKCCGDDLNEFPKYRACFLDTCLLNLSDKACCNDKNSCVYNNNCYSNGTLLDVDGDSYLELCSNGVWLPKKGISKLRVSIEGNKKVKIDEFLSISLEASVEPGNRIIETIYKFEKDSKTVYFIEKYYNNSLNITQNISFIPIRSYLGFFINKTEGLSEFILEINKTIFNSKFIRGLIDNKEFIYPYLVYENDEKAYILVRSERSKNKKRLNLIIQEPLFFPKGKNTISPNKIPDNFYLSLKQFSSNSISVQGSSYDNYKVFCLDNKKVIPFKLENNVLEVLESCNNKILLSKNPKFGDRNEVVFLPSTYLKFK